MSHAHAHSLAPHIYELEQQMTLLSLRPQQLLFSTSSDISQVLNSKVGLKKVSRRFSETNVGEEVSGDNLGCGDKNHRKFVKNSLQQTAPISDHSTQQDK